MSELRKLYGPKTGVIREMFPDWSEVDVLFALQETNGDENEAVTRIAEGKLSLYVFCFAMHQSTTQHSSAPAIGEIESFRRNSCRCASGLMAF